MIKEVIGDATLYCGDSNEILDSVDAVDSCVTDPPYGLSFMGKQWDYDVPNKELWRKVANSLKSGGHLLSFFGSRTYHRGVIPIEDAGFEIRDQLMWLYGSGFPKSHDIGKAVDKLQGNEKPSTYKPNDKNAVYGKNYGGGVTDRTPADNEWNGWGTALKPAHEPIVMARKPFKGSVAENVLEHGTGGINIDGCRVGNEGYTIGGKNKSVAFGSDMEKQERCDGALGRYPANVMHDGSEVVQDIFGDKARYFYCPKASKKDRDEGLENFVEAQTTDGNIRSNSDSARVYGANSVLRKNIHPTVKPTELMKYLCTLVTPKEGIVLDPFMGSGSTGKGALQKGFSFVGIEMDEEYFDIACSRIESAQKGQTELF